MNFADKLLVSCYSKLMIEGINLTTNAYFVATNLLATIFDLRVTIKTYCYLRNIYKEF